MPALANPGAVAPPAIDPDSVGFLIFDLARLFRAEFERRVARAGLGITPAEARVLAHLARCGSLRQHRLAERLGVGQMSLTGLLDRLELAGLVERLVDLADRRAKQVRLTPAAEPVLRGIAAIGAEAREIARQGIAPEEWERFRAVALAARDNLAAARDRDGGGPA